MIHYTTEVNDKAYTIRLPMEKPNRTKGKWNKGVAPWNKGKTWDEMFDNETQERLRKHLREISRKGTAGKGCAHPRPVIQMDDDGNRLHWYASSEHAARKLNLIGRNIRAVCYGDRNRCGGFRWKFDDRFM